MKSLLPSELTKYITRGDRSRIDTFIRKIEENEPFETINGDCVILEKNNDLLDELRKDNPVLPQKLKTIGGIQIPYKHLAKTKEFGGESSTKRLTHEIKAIESLNEGIKKNGGNITIKINGKIFTDITHVCASKGTPRADICLMSQDIVVGWISHKAAQFQQWTGAIRSEKIKTHNEVQRFVLDIKSKVVNEFPRAVMFARKIMSDELKLLAVYGDNFSENDNRSDQNIDAVIHGIPTLTPFKDFFILTGSLYTLDHPHVPVGRYEPILAATYRFDRSNFGIFHSRIQLYSYGGTLKRNVVWI